MATNLGQVAALIERDTLPAGELKAIIRKVDGGGVFEDFFLWKDGAWRSFITLFGAVHYSDTAPTDTSKVWLDKNFTPPLIKTYDAVAEEWKAIFRTRSLDFTANFTIEASHHEAYLNVTSASNITVTIDDPGGDEFVCTISRLGSGQVNLSAGAGVTLNGATTGISIAAQFSSVTVRRFNTDKFIVEGII